MKKLLIIILAFYLNAANLHFTLYKKNGEQGNTLLVIGGIHGNEPGGYYAPSFLIRYYDINKGSLWIVPNLNFDSIVKFRRGVYGDMNRKFAFIDKKDKDYNIVEDIKKIILNPKIDMVLNLHDGHGFYRNSWQNSIFNPAAWGQTCIIDQEKIKTNKFGNLGDIARKVSSCLNTDLKKNYHFFNVKNTKTKFKDEQMRLSLTYFAITHGKPAFAIETSKNIKDLPTKIYYQLRAIEEFMKIVGIKYTRNFDLTIPEIKKLLKKEDYVIINGNTILPVKNIDKVINFFPLTSKQITFKSSNPLVAVVKEKNYYVLYEGYNRHAVLYPQYFKNFCKIKKIKIEIDGQKKEITVPSIVKVDKYFKVLSDKRINVIGYSSKQNEAYKKITKDKLIKKYAVDKNHKMFRVEIYDKDSFCGMFLVDFGGKK
ncbi:putative periplasmic protein [Nautilia profundicola AmH]|uniref:Periplasmic protein n=1 Tax=Nautilia profundicola (strain ATCC BAA-1463 / DSM 18972 / AmH) TaxID=598659 RepID=B9L639_NAUPA|nr:M99 family carboxypeptidase catalytic domain-containing protein [Nautilia profundicola]ACM93771.1 putative periplasmic protein [Nautilia profundicola AmH]